VCCVVAAGAVASCGMTTPGIIDAAPGNMELDSCGMAMPGGAKPEVASAGFIKLVRPRPEPRPVPSPAARPVPSAAPSPVPRVVARLAPRLVLSPAPRPVPRPAPRPAVSGVYTK
jgi:hypothetical protein